MENLELKNEYIRLFEMRLKLQQELAIDPKNKFSQKKIELLNKKISNIYNLLN